MANITKQHALKRHFTCLTETSSVTSGTGPDVRIIIWVTEKLCRSISKPLAIDGGCSSVSLVEVYTSICGLSAMLKSEGTDLSVEKHIPLTPNGLIIWRKKEKGSQCNLSFEYY
jgi:hypothetical protein